MSLNLDRAQTALLVLHFQNDIVDAGGAFKDFGFAAHVTQNDVLAKTARLLQAA